MGETAHSATDPPRAFHQKRRCTAEQVSGIAFRTACIPETLRQRYPIKPISQTSGHNYLISELHRLPLTHSRAIKYA